MEKSAQQGKQEADYSVDQYGSYGHMGSFHHEKTLIKIKEVGMSQKDTCIWVRGRVSNIRQKGNLAFIVLRDNMFNLQCVASKSETVSKQMLKFISTITKESIIDIQADVIQPKEEILSCTQKEVELQVKQVFILSKADNNLPFQLEDANRRMEENDELDCGDVEDKKEEEEGKEENK